VSGQFDPIRPPITVRGVLVGPRRAAVVLFRLDTGASHTSVRSHNLRYVGYDPETEGRPRRLRSVTGVGTGLEVQVRHLAALGHTRAPFHVVAHDPPAAVVTDGLLGFDFFRGLVLTLDFAAGRIALRPPRRWWRLWR
jgi:hypothetical protein